MATDVYVLIEAGAAMSHAHHTMRDGSTVSGEPRVVAAAALRERAYYERERQWCDELREAGIRAAHPDDGWVDRDANTVHFAYPQFAGRVEPGDLIALGQPDDYRVVRVTGTIAPGPIMAPCMRPGEVYRYSFEPVARR